MIFKALNFMGEKMQSVYGSQFHGFILCTLFLGIRLEYRSDLLLLRAFDQAKTQ